MKSFNRRQRALALLLFALILLCAVTTAGIFLSDQDMVTDFSRKNLAPCRQFLFGTDWMGRDMFSRTLTGLSLSIRIGLLTAAVSAVIALLLGSASALLGGWADSVISWLIDLVMGIPHILLVMLISLAFGKGFTGVVAGVALSHWTSLARVVRSEVLQIKGAPYVLVAGKLGLSRGAILRRHMIPHLLPQFLTGLVLLFPHAILHEASITFLGFGLSPEEPAIGIILSESMKYLAMGKWWLALFPGLLLTAVVLMFHYAGQTICRMAAPGSVHE